MSGSLEACIYLYPFLPTSMRYSGSYLGAISTNTNGGTFLSAKSMELTIT